MSEANLIPGTIAPSITLLAVLNLCGAAQGILLALALLKVKARGENRTANRLLAALTTTISIVVTGAVLVSSNYVFVFPHLSRLHQPFAFLGGPLLFLYVRTITTAKRMEKKDLLHFLPFALCLLYLTPFFLQSRANKLAQLSTEFTHLNSVLWYYVRSVVFFLQFLAYLIAITITIYKFSHSVNRESSANQKAILLRLKIFQIASAVLLSGAILRLFVDVSWDTNLLVPLGASVLVYAMGYLEMVKPESVVRMGEILPSRKYERSSLTPERAQKYRRRLIELMDVEKPYMDGSLTIQKLSQDLAIPSHHLSQLINEQLGQTFSEFLNSYRVEEAKRRLLDPACKHLSILGIAVDVGFNSKSSFNAVFKKYTNLTPSEFRSGDPQTQKEHSGPSFSPPLTTSQH